MRNILPIVFIFAVIFSSLGYFVSSLTSSPGVRLSFKFHGNNGLLETRFGFPILPKGRVYVEVYAIAPPSYVESEIRIWNGTLRTSYLTIPNSGVFRKIVDGFYEYLDNLNISDNIKSSMKYGLRIDLWLFMENGAVISDTQYVTYSPWLIHRGNIEDKLVVVDLARPILKYNVYDTIGKMYENQQDVETGTADTKSITPLTSTVCVWLPEWDITPNDLAENGAPYIVVNGAKYIEIPVAIVENRYYYSGSIAFSYEIDSTYTTALTVSIGVGYDLSSKVASGSYDVGSLGVTLYRAGYSVEKNAYFYDNLLVSPEETVYYYIYARPYTVLEKEVCYYYGSPVGQPTGNERIRTYIGDFLVNGTRIVGGAKQGWPPTIVYSLLYNDNSSNLQQITIPDDPQLSDGDLDVGETIAYVGLFDYYDTCGSGFEVSVPTGLIAAGACLVLSGGSCAPFAALLASIPISLEVNPGDTTISVHGGLKNCGDGAACGIQGSNGYNVAEMLYNRVSKLKYRVYYWTGEYCEFNVPVSMYFRSD